MIKLLNSNNNKLAETLQLYYYRTETFNKVMMKSYYMVVIDARVCLFRNTVGGRGVSCVVTSGILACLLCHFRAWK